MSTDDSKEVTLESGVWREVERQWPVEYTFEGELIIEYLEDHGGGAYTSWELYRVEYMDYEMKQKAGIFDSHDAQQYRYLLRWRHWTKDNGQMCAADWVALNSLPRVGSIFGGDEFPFVTSGPVPLPVVEGAACVLLDVPRDKYDEITSPVRAYPRYTWKFVRNSTKWQVVNTLMDILYYGAYCDKYSKLPEEVVRQRGISEVKPEAAAKRLLEDDIFKVLRLIYEHDIEKHGTVVTDISDPVKILEALYLITAEEVVHSLKSLEGRLDTYAKKGMNYRLWREAKAIFNDLFYTWYKE